MLRELSRLKNYANGILELGLCSIIQVVISSLLMLV